MCTIDVVILFLMLASEMTIVDLGLDIVQRIMLSSLWKWVALLSMSLWFVWLKEKQLEKVLTSL